MNDSSRTNYVCHLFTLHVLIFERYTICLKGALFLYLVIILSFSLTVCSLWPKSWSIQMFSVIYERLPFINIHIYKVKKVSNLAWFFWVIFFRRIKTLILLHGIKWRTNDRYILFSAPSFSFLPFVPFPIIHHFIYAECHHLDHVIEPLKKKKKVCSLAVDVPSCKS